MDYLVSYDDGEVPRGMRRACMVITLQSFMYGYVMACFNACLATGNNNSGNDCFHNLDSSCPKGTVYNDIDLTQIQAAAVTALTALGALLGALVSSRPAEALGRKPILKFNCFLFIAGAALASSGHNRFILFAGRFISGIGVGFASTVTSALLCEIAPDESRGSISTLHQLMISLGIFVAGVVSYGLATYVDHGWQYIQAFTGIPAVATLMLQRYLPESPKWLVTQHLRALESPHTSLSFNPLGHILESYVPSKMSADDERLRSEHYVRAQRVLRGLRQPTVDIQRELSMMLTAQQGGDREDLLTWREVFAYKKALWIGGGLMVFQAITGINSVVFYSTTIYSMAGFGESVVGTACVGMAQLVCAAFVAVNIDQVGRKALLLTGSCMMFVSLVVMSVALLVPAPDLVQGIVAVVALLFYVGSFVLGLGSVSWTVMNEVIPTRVRMRAVSLILALNWLGNLLISSLTLMAIDGLGGVEQHSMDQDEEDQGRKTGVALLYFVFAGVTAGAIVFIRSVVPETTGINTEEVDHNRSFNTPLMPENRPHARDSALISS